MTGTDWRKGVKGNGLLYETYYYKCDSEYEVPHNKPNQRCLTSDQIDALQAINFVPSDPRGLTHDETRIINVHKILTFLRNHHVHRMEAIAAGIHLELSRFDFRASHSEFVSMVKFHRVLAVVQYHLYRMGKLDEPNLL